MEVPPSTPLSRPIPPHNRPSAEHASSPPTRTRNAQPNLRHPHATRVACMIAGKRGPRATTQSPHSPGPPSPWVPPSVRLPRDDDTRPATSHPLCKSTKCPPPPPPPPSSPPPPSAPRTSLPARCVRARRELGPVAADPPADQPRGCRGCPRAERPVWAPRLSSRAALRCRAEVSVLANTSSTTA